MTLDEIRELIKAVLDSGVAELEVQQGDSRVRIRRTPRATSHEVYVPPTPAPGVPAHPAPVAQAAASVAAAAPAQQQQPVDVTNDPSLIIVKSPIVGTFYEAPAPDAAPFVRVGDTVQPGKVLCIIESMKLMNEIEAETSGVIVSKLVENGHPVEYGEALFAMRPL
jgi:acetyl-CoA carboxylase, biotin carboxyl carrier protein